MRNSSSRASLPIMERIFFCIRDSYNCSGGVVPTGAVWTRCEANLTFVETHQKNFDEALNFSTSEIGGWASLVSTVCFSCYLKIRYPCKDCVTAEKLCDCDIIFKALRKEKTAIDSEVKPSEFFPICLRRNFALKICPFLREVPTV